MAPSIAVIIPTYRRPQQLERLVTRLADQTLPTDQWTVTVVDDCSGPALDAVLARLPAALGGPVEVLRSPTNEGPAHARNLGWRSTDAELLAFIDDDVFPDPDWLAAGLKALADDERVGVLEGCTRVPDGTDLASLPRWSVWRDIASFDPGFYACNIFYRRAALEAVGGFDEAIAWWGEDTATGWKVLEAGWKAGFEPAASVVHDVEVRGRSWFVKQGWLDRNLIRVAREHRGYREAVFWRPWAIRPSDTAFKLALVALIAGLRWRPALLGVAPYLWWGRPPAGEPDSLQRRVDNVPIDAARSAGQVVGAIRHRTLVV